jgi:acyl-CoA synthetase (NDP forming)
MNEKIRELAEQAGLKWKAQPPHYTNTNNPIDFPVSANRDLEKFAELIIRECAEVARLNTRVDSKVYLMIKEHFGVEE